MKKIIFLLLLLIAIPVVYSASVIDSKLLEERYGLKTIFIHEDGTIYSNEEFEKAFKSGIEMKGKGYVILDENVKCEYIDFVYNGCGKEYTEKLPCVKEDKAVWPFEHCCDGSEEYDDNPSFDGQTRCVKISEISVKISEIKKIKNNQTINLIIFTIIILAIGFLIFYIIKKIIKGKKKIIKRKK